MRDHDDGEDAADREPRSGGAVAGEEDRPGDGDRVGDDDEPVDHLAEVPDGCGCAEIWEYLAERRRE